MTTVFGFGKKKKDDKGERESKEEKKDKESSKEEMKKSPSGSPKTLKSSSRSTSVYPLHLSKSMEFEDGDAISFLSLLSNPQYSDLVFLVGQPFQKISAHSCVVEARCPSLLKNAKKKKNINEVEVESSISFATFQVVLVYVYSDSIDWTQLKLEDVVLLLSASSKYEGLERLKFLCNQYLRKELNLSNVHILLKLANSLDLKEFKEVVLHFAVSHYSDFISNKEALNDLGITFFHEVVDLQQKGVKDLPEETEPKSTFLGDFKGLYDSSKQSDVTFLLAEANAMGNLGTTIRGHKAIVVARAPGLQSIINQPLTEVSKTVSGVSIKKISPEAFESVLKWAYYGETHAPSLIACELIPFCQQYDLPLLQKVCLDNIKKNIKVDTVLTILDISYLKENMPAWFVEEMEKFRPKCIEFAAKHLKDIDISVIRTKNLNNDIAPDILIFLQGK